MRLTNSIVLSIALTSAAYGQKEAAAPQGEQLFRGTYDAPLERVTLSTGARAKVAGSKGFKRLLAASSAEVVFRGVWDGSDAVRPVVRTLTGRLMHDGDLLWLQEEGGQKTLLVNLRKSSDLAKAMHDRQITLRTYVIETDGERIALSLSARAKLTERVLVAHDDLIVSWKPGVTVWVEGTFSQGEHQGKGRVARSLRDKKRIAVPLSQLSFGPKFHQISGKLEESVRGHWVVDGRRLEGVSAELLADFKTLRGQRVALEVLDATESATVFELTRPRRVTLEGHYRTTGYLKVPVGSRIWTYAVRNHKELGLEPPIYGTFEGWRLEHREILVTKYPSSKPEAGAAKGAAGKVEPK